MNPEPFHWRLKKISELKTYAIYKMVDVDVTATIWSDGKCRIMSDEIEPPLVHDENGIECDLDWMVDRLTELQQISKGILIP